MTKKIVIAHFNENLDWIQDLNFDGEVVIYSKTDQSNPERFIELNKGQEVPMYLKYIIDNYGSLPDSTLFLHGHLHSPHQDYDSKFICENLNWGLSDYFSVNKRDWYQEVSNYYSLSGPAFNVWLKQNWYIFQNLLDFPENGLFFYSGAQFVVSKESIMSHPKNFYVNLYDWVLSTSIDIPPQTSNEIVSRIFEYTWHYIFTKNSVENKYSYGEIFNK